MVVLKYLVFIAYLNLSIAVYWHGEQRSKTKYVAAENIKKIDNRLKRQIGSQPIYTIELLMVIDFSQYKFWKDRVQEESSSKGVQFNETDVIVKIRKFYASIGESVNFRFQNISDADLNIGVEVVGIFIAEAEKTSYWTESNKKISTNGIIYVDGDKSLDSFNTWVNDQSNNLTRHDHAMLFTRYNLKVLNDSAVSGLTFSGKMCSRQSVSIVEEDFDFISATSAARLIGYCLGALDDGDGNQCGPYDMYIMSPNNSPGYGDTALNPWRFSSCSVVAFITFLSGLNRTQGGNCLLFDDAVAITDIRAFPGSEYPLDDQCRFTKGSSSFMCKNNIGENICTGMLCFDNTTNGCGLVLPGDGLACGTGKWCVNGLCVESPHAAKCLPGTYRSSQMAVCRPCAAGTYQPYLTEQKTCTPCPIGTYQPNISSVECLPCRPGYNQNSTGQSSCIPCTEGYYNPITGAGSCRSCEIGTFQNSTGQYFCFPCPGGYTTEQDGSWSAQECFQGYCPEYKVTVNVSTYTINVTIPSTRVNQTGYSWSRCNKDSNKALLSAFCQNISRTEVIWTQVRVLENCVPEQPEDVNTSSTSEQLFNISKMNIDKNNLVNVLQDTNSILQLPHTMTAVDVTYLADILDKVNTIDTVSKEVLNETLDIVNAILKSNSSSIQGAQKSFGSANRILKTLEEISSKVEGGTDTNPVKVIKANIASTVWKQSGDTLRGIKILQKNAGSIESDSVMYLKTEPPETKSLEAAIYFQSDILKGMENMIGMTAIWNDALFKAGSGAYKVVSKIMTAKIFKNGVSVTKLGNYYVKAVFLSTESDGQIVCGYWDYTVNENGGGWAIDGCNHTTDENIHVCTCNHLTNFAVLVDLEAKSLPPEHKQALEIITYIGLIVSIVGLGLTILTFMCFRHLRRGRGQQTLFCLCIPMLCYSVIFLLGITRTEQYVPCIIISALMHYFIVTAFMWMLIEGVLQYLRFVKVLGTYIPNFLIKTSIPAWGIPLVPVIVLLVYNYDLYYGGIEFCWMKQEVLLYAFIFPICSIILANVIIFAIVLFHIFRRPRGITINQSEKKIAILNIKAAISILILLGITWIFGVVAFGGAKLIFQYIFVILNAFQGFFIFLLFTAREKQVRDQWARFCCRRPTGYFTSNERKYSSQDSVETILSGRKQSTSSSLTDDTERRPSTSSV